MTLTQKILAAHARGLSRPWVQAGDLLQISVDWTIASELAWNGMERTYDLLGRPPIFDREKFYLAIDHTVDPVTLATDVRAQKLVKLSQNFAKEAKLRHFYDSNQTILHTKFYRDLVLPGDVVLGADSHTSSHGGLGAFSIGLGGGDIAVAMVLGESWIEVPEAISIEYTGALPFGIGGKDVILRTLGALGRNTVAMERSVEYRGNAVRAFSTDTRFTIANMTAEFGGLNGIFEADEVVARWISQRPAEGGASPASLGGGGGRVPHSNAGHKKGARYFRADPDAPYCERHTIDLSALTPQVAMPFAPDNVRDVASQVGQNLDGLFIGACTTTEEELVLGALVLEQDWAGRAARGSQQKQLVVPGSLDIEARLRERGLWAAYERAGFRVGPPGCSMCLGVASEKAGKGEVWLSSQNRNFKNRMGEGSLAWLSSAATVAASAGSMTLTDPRALLARVDQARYRKLLGRDREERVPEIVISEPSIAERDGVRVHESGREGDSDRGLVRGRAQKFGDSVDTDAIIPGEFCHLTKLEDLGAKCFHLVRPDFATKVAAGANVVVAGEGWGSGSSREQAVLALKGAGVQVVIARSYAFIHKRNLVNEAVAFLQVNDAAFAAITNEGDEISVDLAKGVVTHVSSGKTFAAVAPSPVVRALQREGGLVPAVKRHGAKVFAELT